MSNLQTALARLGKSALLTSLGAITQHNPEIQEMIRQSAERELATMKLERRLANDRVVYGITLEQQRKLAETGSHEAALSVLTRVCDE